MKNTFEKDEILDFLSNNGIISIEDVETIMKRKEIEAAHQYAIYQGKDGRWRTYVKDEEKGRRLIVKKNQRDLFNELHSIYGIQAVTIRNLYPEWLEFKRLHTNAYTYIRRITNDWNKYYIQDPIIDIPISNLDKNKCDKWAHFLIQKYNLTKKAYYNITVIIRQVLDYAVETGRIKNNPFSFFSVNKRLFRPEMKKPGEKEVYLIDEERLLKEYAWEQFRKKSHKKQPLVPLAILFQLQTGMRLGELRAVTWDDVRENYISVTKFVREESGEIVYHTKGTYGDRLIPLTDEAKRILNEAKPYSSNYIFSITEKPLSSTAVDRAYYKYCDALGIERKSSHKVRKTVISSLIDSGMNIDTVRKIAGHTDERTTYKCYCYDRNPEKSNLDLMNQALL